MINTLLTIGSVVTMMYYRGFEFACDIGLEAAIDPGMRKGIKKECDGLLALTTDGLWLGTSIGLGALYGGVIGTVFGLFEGSLLSLSYPLISKYRPRWNRARFAILPAYVLFNIVIDDVDNN